MKSKFYVENLISNREAFGEYISRCFFITQKQRSGIMADRFSISWVVENGHPHYKVYDKVTDMEIHCDENELNETIWQLLEM